MAAVTICTPETFSPSLFGAEILSVSAHLVSNYSLAVPSAFRFVAPSVSLNNASFCNVTVTYTHTGTGDEVNMEAWLPLDNWNKRLQAFGGGGFIAGRSFDLSYPGMSGALFDGFAAVSTDAGVRVDGNVAAWALRSPGNVDWNKLQNLAHVSLGEQAILSKSVVKSFYGQDPDYSYWTGCSGGGRQGLMLAQRYPTAYDGIIAVAPAIYWNQDALNIQWAQQIMNEIGEYPPACEFEAIADAAVAACDGLDKVVDGIITNAQECLDSFDPFTVVGKTISCKQKNGTQIQVSSSAATVTKAAWHGMTSTDGKAVWHGFAPGSDISGLSPLYQGIIGSAMTDCNQTSCSGHPVLGYQWMQYFLIKENPSINFESLSRSEFLDFLHFSVQQYDSIIGTNDPDLTRFHKAGGKIMTYHGINDQLLPIGVTEQYFNKVAELDPRIDDFFRFYKVPGLGHCWGGRSGQPEQMFHQLRNWVEKGEAPGSSPITVTALNNEVHNRIICPYPQVLQFDDECGDASEAACWACKST